MNDSNGNGKHVHKSYVTLSNPQKKDKGDWWDELCKKHKTRNHWKNEKKKLRPEKEKDVE